MGNHLGKGRVGRSSDFGLDCIAGRRLLGRLLVDHRRTAGADSLVDGRSHRVVVEVDSLVVDRSHPAVGRRVGLVDMAVVRNLVDLGADHLGIVGCGLVDHGLGLRSSTG